MLFAVTPLVALAALSTFLWLAPEMSLLVAVRTCALIRFDEFRAYRMRTRAVLCAFAFVALVLVRVVIAGLDIVFRGVRRSTATLLLG